MISVRNLLQRLNGSKLMLLAIILPFLMVGCKANKRGSSESKTPRPSNAKTTNPNNTLGANKKVKVIDWTITDPQKEVPIGAPTVIKSVAKGDYSVSLLVPFNGNKAGNNELASKESGAYRFACYYAGVQMAAEDNPIQSRVDVHVYDSESADIQSILRRPQVKSSDVIVGPYDSKDLKAVAVYAQSNKITHVSPWKSSKSIANNNPYHVQTKPSLTKHYEQMVADAVKSYPGKDIFVIGKSSSSDQKRMAYIKSLGKSMGRSDIKAYTVNEDSLRIGETAFDNIFNPTATSVVLIPNWSSSDEGFIYGCVRKLRVEKGEADLVVYGMPKMMDTDKISYDFYNNLNIHIIRSDYVDKESASAQRLRRRFFDQYNAFPTDDLYEGFDMMSFVLNNLDRHGANFQTKVGVDRSGYLQTAYDIIPVPRESVEKIKGPDDINYYENNALQVLQFQNGKFIKK